MSYERLNKDIYYLSIAEVVAKRSTCIRRQYGAVLVKNDEIIATGYNGSPRGHTNCCDSGICWREENNVPHGEQYEKCCAVHAEQNCLISASRKDTIGSTLYLFGIEDGHPINQAKPCDICYKMLVNAGIDNIVSVTLNEVEDSKNDL